MCDDASLTRKAYEMGNVFRPPRAHPAGQRHLPLRPDHRDGGLLLGTLRRAVVDVGLDGARTDGIDPDPMAAELQGQLLHHGELGRLAGRIGGGTG